jgi:hypothetical protein
VSSYYNTANAGQGPLTANTTSTATPPTLTSTPPAHQIPSFYTAKTNEMAQQGAAAPTNPYLLTDQVMGLPILYYRAQPGAQPGVTVPVAESAGVYFRAVNSVFTDGSVTAYGPLGPKYGQVGNSLLSLAAGGAANLAGVVDNQGTSDPNNPNIASKSQARGGFALIAANQDGYYLSAAAAAKVGAANPAVLTMSGWNIYDKMMSPVYVGGRAP